MKKAFTLAEVLITLAIIGVVAAMTIPTLVADYQKQVFVTALKKNYSILSQVTQSITFEIPTSEWNYTDGNLAAVQALHDYYKPYLKIMKDCGCGVSNLGCMQEEKTKALNGMEALYANSASVSTDAECRVVLADGTLLSFGIWGGSPGSILGYSGASPAALFVVDVNGYKAPNMYGRDKFPFIITKDKDDLIPAGRDNNSPLCTPADTTNLAGRDCTAKVLKEDKMDY